MKILFVITVVSAACGVLTDASPFLNKLEKSSRQKRLLFYDDQGHLVKTYANNFYHVGQTDQQNLFQWSFLNTFLNPIFPANIGRASILYMIPVSDAVVQQINRDPIYQNKIFYLTHLDPIVQANPLCAGKQTQIPSPNLCSNFLNCWNGWAFEQECPAGLLFSNEGFCDYPNSVDCKNRKLKNPQPLCNKDFEATINPSNCSEFFVCVNSIPVKFECPSGLEFSETLGVCDYPSRVECSNNPSTKAPSIIQTIQQSTQADPIANTTISESKGEPTLVLNSVTNKTEYNSQTWTSTHVAISRQDAIRQLKLGSMGQTSMGN